MTQQEFNQRFTYDPSDGKSTEGGFSDVYEAWDNKYKNAAGKPMRVALKFFKTQDKKYNIDHEISIAIGLQHPNICRYLDSIEKEGVDDHGRKKIIQVAEMEWIDGGHVDDFLAKQENRKHLDKILIDILRGLSYLHNCKDAIIHRDIKPSNVMICYLKQNKNDAHAYSTVAKEEINSTSLKENEYIMPCAKIIDFGISKVITGNDKKSTRLFGTKQYIAPEQIDEFSFGIKKIKENGTEEYNIDNRVDIWSFGVMAYGLITGKKLFEGIESATSDEQVRKRILGENLSGKLQLLEPKYKQLLEKCLVRKAADRCKEATTLIGIINDNRQAGGGQKTKPVQDAYTHTYTKPPVTAQPQVAEKKALKIVLQLQQKKISDLDLCLLLMDTGGHSATYYYKARTGEKKFNPAYNYLGDVKRKYKEDTALLTKLDIFKELDDIVLTIAKGGNKKSAIDVYAALAHVNDDTATSHVNNLVNTGKATFTPTINKVNLVLTALEAKQIHPFDLCLLLLDKASLSATYFFGKVANTNFETSNGYINALKLKYKYDIEKLTKLDVINNIDHICMQLVKSGDKNSSIYLYLAVANVYAQQAAIHINSMLGNGTNNDEGIKNQDDICMAVRHSTADIRKGIVEVKEEVDYKLYGKRITAILLSLFFVYQLFQAKAAFSALGSESFLFKAFWELARSIINLPDIFGLISDASLFITILLISYGIKSILSLVVLITGDNDYEFDVFSSTVSITDIFAWLCIIECVVFGMAFGFTPVWGFIKSAIVLQISSGILGWLLFDD